MTFKNILIILSLLLGLSQQAHSQDFIAVSGQYVQSTEHDFLCEDGSEINIPFWISQKNYLWSIDGDVLTISFKAKIMGVTVSDVSIDYQLTPISQDELFAVPSQSDIDDYGASQFTIRVLDHSDLLAIRGDNPRHCEGNNSHMYMTSNIQD